MVNSNTVELAEWIGLYVISFGWMVVAFLSDASRILESDKPGAIKKKHKQTRRSTTISNLALAALLLGIGVTIIWTEQADTFKDGGTIRVQYYRWIGIGLYLFFLSWAYSNYSAIRETDWRILQITVFLGGVAGTLGTLVTDDTKLQVVAYVFIAVFYLGAAVMAFRYTNIKPVGFGWNYLAWFLIYVTAPIIFYLLLIFGPEGTKVENGRGLIAIGYLVISISHAVLPGLIIVLTFMATKRLSIPVELALTRLRKVANAEMTSNSSISSPLDSLKNQ